MGVRMEDLPVRVQQQIVGKLQKERASKYHNVKAERPGKNGSVIRFDSQAEARRYDQLVLLLQAGRICDLRMQVEYLLKPSYRTWDGMACRSIRYKADFVYQELLADGTRREVVEDVKGGPTRTKEYILKKKLMLDRFGIEIKEVE